MKSLQTFLICDSFLLLEFQFAQEWRLKQIKGIIQHDNDNFGFGFLLDRLRDDLYT